MLTDLKLNISGYKRVSLVQFLSNDTVETKKAILAFLYCWEFVKNWTARLVSPPPSPPPPNLTFIFPPHSSTFWKKTSTFYPTPPQDLALSMSPGNFDVFYPPPISNFIKFSYFEFCQKKVRPAIAKLQKTMLYISIPCSARGSTTCSVLISKWCLLRLEGRHLSKFNLSDELGFSSSTKIKYSHVVDHNFELCSAKRPRLQQKSSKYIVCHPYNSIETVSIFSIFRSVYSLK